MITHTITGANGTSQIILGESLTRLDTYIQGRKTILITDEQVAPLYQKFVSTPYVAVIGCGETIKTLATVEQLYDRLLQADADRSAFVLAIGGGIVCDIAGFAASTYMRGLRFGFVPTTLLAQVDASVGGKNGVNFQGYKNLVGTFTQPEFVLINFEVLGTLPPKTLGCGLAEAIKHGAIADMDLFTFMEERCEDIRNLKADAVERIVHDSVIIKSTIVNQDEKEHGERRKLNFGHTFGHAIEKTLKLPHGESVAIGMIVAARLSQQRGYLSNADVARLRRMLEAYHLPVTIEADMDTIRAALRKDKKRYGETIKFVLLREIGKAVIENVSLEELDAAVQNL